MTLFSGRVFQRLRCYLPGAGQGLNFSLECSGLAHRRPAELILYCTKLMLNNPELMATTTDLGLDTNETGHRHISEAEI